jgi:hypothetical protein
MGSYLAIMCCRDIGESDDRLSASNKAAEPSTVLFTTWFAHSARSIAYELAHVGNLDD